MRSSVLLPSLAVFGVGLCAAVAAERLRTPEEVVQWTREHAVPLTAVEAGRGFADLEPLRQMIGSARVVALGEATHGSREVFQMKHRLLEFLATELGFTVLAVEANLPEARRVNDYVIDGKGDLAAVLRGLYFSTWRSEEVFAMVEWMRRFNVDAGHRRADRQVVFAGFDMQEPDVAMTAVQDYVARRDSDWAPKVAEAKQSLAGVQPRDPVGMAISSFPVELVRGRRIVFSGWIKTENVRDGYAGLLWRADTAAKSAAALANMYHTGPRGTTGWKRYEIALDVPADTVVVQFGLLLEGKGIAWFDDLEITIDGAPYHPGGEFDFEFERDGLVGFHASRHSYRARTVAQPHRGNRSLEFTSVDQGEDTSRRAGELWREIEEHLRAAVASGMATPDARYAAQCARVMNQFLALNSPDRRHSGPEMRDDSMAENVKWILDENPGAKIVLWAHNGHVRRGDAAMGGFLAERLSDEMVVVGFATGSGSYQAWSDQGPAAFPLQPPIEGSVEAVLAATRVPRFVVDLRPARAGGPAHWFAEPHPHRLIGGGEVKSQFEVRRPVARDYDLLFWIGETSASVTRPR